MDDLQDDPEGVLVCLQCFNGGCFGEGRRHAWLHYEKSKHPLGVVVKRARKEGKKRVSSSPRKGRLCDPTHTRPVRTELKMRSRIRRNPL